MYSKINRGNTLICLIIMYVDIRINKYVASISRIISQDKQDFKLKLKNYRYERLLEPLAI